jgi:hypothetical protein
MVVIDRGEMAMELEHPAHRAEPLPGVPKRYEATPAERAALGKAARKQAPLSSHARWQPAPERPDPVGLLESQALERAPDLVPIRYGRMPSSAFAFYRGGALIMASDLSRTPVSGLRAQMCGDAPLMNFGLFDRAIADFAEAYADQNQLDFEALQEAEAAGRITAERGV